MHVLDACLMHVLWEMNERLAVKAVQQNDVALRTPSHDGRKPKVPIRQSASLVSFQRLRPCHWHALLFRQILHGATKPRSCNSNPLHGVAVLLAPSHPCRIHHCCLCRRRGRDISTLTEFQTCVEGLDLQVSHRPGSIGASMELRRLSDWALSSRHVQRETAPMKLDIF